MEKQDKLHSLIQSLSKSEKRFFRLFSNLSGTASQKKYLKIFEVFLHEKKYDEAAIKEKLRQKGIVSLTNWGSDKNYLYLQILESLRLQHKDAYAKTRARFHLDTSNILYKKGLYRASLSECSKAKKLVEKYNIISMMPDILLQERILKSYLGPPFSISELEDVIQQFNASLTDLDQFNKYDYLYRSAISSLYTKGKARTEEDYQHLKQIEEKLQQLSINNNKGIHSQIRFHQTRAAIFYMKNEPTKEYLEINRIIRLIEEDLDFKEESQFEYITFLSHSLRLSKTIDPSSYPDKLESFLNTPKNLKRDKKKTEARVFSMGYSTHLVKLLDEGNYEEGLSFKPKITQTLKKYKELISTSIHINFEYKFAYLHFGNGELTQALKHVNTILNEYSPNDRTDVYSFARILSLVIHYELGNYSLISYYLKSVVNYLKKVSRLSPYEHAILTTIKLLPRIREEKERKDLLLGKKEEILNFFKNNPDEKHLIVFFDFITWIDSKLENKSFKDTKTGINKTI